MPSGDTIWAEASAALPLPAVMRHEGDGDAVPTKFGGTSKAPRCPFCGGGSKGEATWKVDQRADGSYSFHCFRTSCDANQPPCGNGEIGYLALKRGLSRKDACIAFLDMALPDRKRDETQRRKDAEKKDEVQPNAARNLRGGPWHELWKKLPLNAADIAKTTKKRGLSHETLELCGVRSNNAGNRELVLGLALEFPEVELVELGILKSENGRITAAGQLTGWGRTGEHHCKPCDRTYSGKHCPKCNRKARSEDAVWSGDVEPPIFPYFGKDGAAIYLRPHKGGVRNRELKLLQELEIPDEDAEDHECASHVYVPPNFSELLAASDGTAVFTEGEWKAMALAQCDIPALACPGITFIRNPAFREELLDLLRFHGVRDLVIIFDNEDKGNPALPGYQPDPRKQHDAQLWAEYTQADLRTALRSRGGNVKVGRLPDRWPETKAQSAKSEPHNAEWDKWRDGAGKADFDGILGTLVASHGMEQGTKRARLCFRQCILRASDNPASDRELFPFPGSVRRILDRRLYLLQNRKEKLASGDYTERELAKAFRTWDAQGVFSHEPMPDGAKPRPHMVDRMMAEAFEEVAGCYYVRKSIYGKDKDARDAAIASRAACLGKIKAIREANMHGLTDAQKAEKHAELNLLLIYERSLRERLKGRPVPISSCTLKGEFRLRKPGGETVRLVSIFDSRDRKKESILYNFKKEEASSPQKFREWLTGIGKGGWSTGQEALDKLSEQINDDVYLCDIHSVTHWGHHEETDIWFYSDGAFKDDRTSKEGASAEIRPDSAGIFWNPLDGLGYKLETASEDGTSHFALGAPKLFGPQRGEDDETEENLFIEGNLGDLVENFIAKHFSAPETKPVRELLKEMRASHDGDGDKGGASPNIEALITAAGVGKIPLPDFTRPDPATGQPMTALLTPREALETEVVRLIFTQMRDDLVQTVGDRDAWLAIGVMCAYAFGPELVQHYLCHPGLTVTGGFGSGKTETLRRLCRIWGMKKFVDLAKSSPIGLGRTLAQYSSLPVQIDGYDRGSDPKWKEYDALLKTATQRGDGLKGNIVSPTSTTSTPPRTSPVVTGENSPQDSATASRYVPITMGQARRRPGSPKAWERIKAWAPHYYHLGRWLIRRRSALAKTAMTRIKAWMQSADVAAAFGDQDRMKLTHGVALCTFQTVAEMLGLPLPEAEATSFREFTTAYGARNMTNVKDDTFRNRFWNDIITALNRPASTIKPKFFSLGWLTVRTPEGELIPHNHFLDTSMLRKMVLDEKRPYRLCDTTTEKHKYAVPVVFIAARAIYDEWQRDLASRRLECPISYANLRAEIDKEEYFVPAPKTAQRRDRDDHRRRFALDDNTVSARQPCWCVSLGRHISTKDGSLGDFYHPFAQAIIDALGRQITPSEAETEDREEENGAAEA